MYGNSTDSGTVASDTGTRVQRYNYLQGRLRSRQITMEEATELFALMQGMIARSNELARVAAMRAAPSSPATPSAPPPPMVRTAPAGGGSDDLLLVGILAMGAGAGLLAALSKRIGDAAPASPSGSGSSTSSAAPR